MIDTKKPTDLIESAKQFIAKQEAEISLLKKLPVDLELEQHYCVRDTFYLRVRGDIKKLLNTFKPLRIDGSGKETSYGADIAESTYPLEWVGEVLSWTTNLQEKNPVKINFVTGEDFKVTDLPNIAYFSPKIAPSESITRYSRKLEELTFTNLSPESKFDELYQNFALKAGLDEDQSFVLMNCKRYAKRRILLTADTYKDYFSPTAVDKFEKSFTPALKEEVFTFVAENIPPFNLEDLEETYIQQVLDQAQAAVEEIMRPLQGLAMKQAPRWEYVEHYVRKKTGSPVSLTYRSMRKSYQMADTHEYEFWLYFKKWNRGHIIQLSSAAYSPQGFDWNDPGFVEFVYPPKK